MYECIHHLTENDKCCFLIKNESNLLLHIFFSSLLQIIFQVVLKSYFVKTMMTLNLSKAQFKSEFSVGFSLFSIPFCMNVSTYEFMRVYIAEYFPFRQTDDTWMILLLLLLRVIYICTREPKTVMDALKKTKCFLSTVIQCSSSYDGF